MIITINISIFYISFPEINVKMLISENNGMLLF